MTAALYPPVMGMFCTGYVLHLVWRAWDRRRNLLARRRLMFELSLRQEHVFVAWEPLIDSVQSKASPVRNAA